MFQARASVFGLVSLCLLNSALANSARAARGSGSMPPALKLRGSVSGRPKRVRPRGG